MYSIDDESQPEDRQSISESSKESVKEFKSQPATEEQLTALSNITQKEFPEMPLADSPTCPALSPLDQEIHSKEVVPEMSLVDVPTLPASLSPGRKLCGNNEIIFLNLFICQAYFLYGSAVEICIHEHKET